MTTPFSYLLEVRLVQLNFSRSVDHLCPIAIAGFTGGRNYDYIRLCYNVHILSLEVSVRKAQSKTSAKRRKVLLILAIDYSEKITFVKAEYAFLIYNIKYVEPHNSNTRSVSSRMSRQNLEASNELQYEFKSSSNKRSVESIDVTPLTLATKSYYSYQKDHSVSFRPRLYCSN